MKTFDEWLNEQPNDVDIYPFSAWEASWKNAQEEISNRNERIKELEQKLKYSEMAARAEAKYADELAVQNQQLRDLLPKRIPNGFVSFGKYYTEQEDLFADPYNKMSKFKKQYLTQCNEVLTLPDLASPVLNKVKAEALRAFSRTFAVSGLGNADLVNPGDVVVALHKMADTIEKGEG